VEEHTIVAVIAEGKQYAMAVGMTQMSTEAM
jgi:predicted ribosome-associated RNA-binding protein Tma20